MKSALTIIPALLLASAAGLSGRLSQPSADDIAQAQAGTKVCIKWGEQFVGMSKFCYYNCRGTVYSITISVVKECPKTR